MRNYFTFINNYNISSKSWVSFSSKRRSNGLNLGGLASYSFCLRSFLLPHFNRLNSPTSSPDNHERLPLQTTTVFWQEMRWTRARERRRRGNQTEKVWIGSHFTGSRIKRLWDTNKWSQPAFSTCCHNSCPEHSRSIWLAKRNGKQSYFFMFKTYCELYSSEGWTS